MGKAHRTISAKDYTYQLPAERIALYPVEERDTSKLLVYKNGKIDETIFNQITEHLAGPALMVFNNTRVVQARLLFRKPAGAAIEIFCLTPAGSLPDIQMAFGEKRESTWFCLVGNAKKWKQGPLHLEISEDLTLTAEKVTPQQEGYMITFRWETDISFAEVLELAGKTPLPPYIDRQAETADKSRYQTVYAHHSGSVAAPTAGLHFTDRVLARLSEQNISKAFVTLHVGAGTFKPVSAETIGEHAMHSEQVAITRQTISDLIRHHGNIISVGTTSMRTLESLYWLGAKLINGYNLDKNGFFDVAQWDPYENDFHTLPDPAEALRAIAAYMDLHKLDVLQGFTSLIIVPGYTFRIVKTLVTNFHQPGSTLLLLVAAFCGQGWRDIYNHALENGFRFLSYGDSCLIFGH